MQRVLWARARPRIAPLQWIGHRFRSGPKPSKKPKPSPSHHSSGPPSFQQKKWDKKPNNRAPTVSPDAFPFLEGTTVSAQAVLTFFQSNVLAWTLRRTVQDRLVGFGVPAGDAKKLLAAFAHAADTGFFDTTEAVEKYDLLKLRGTDSMEVDVTFSHIFFRWLAAQDSVRGVDAATTTALVRLAEAATVMHPAEEHLLARSMRRKFIMHVGPTNSGKTHHALRALAAAKVGVYAGPLRLLAYEIWERLNLGQIVPLGATEEQTAEATKFGPSTDNPFARRCNMVTGEERKMVGVGADVLVSCTVEMLQIGLHADVAVIDEIQMIGDPQRGSGWTHAVLGLCAKEIHLCGEETAVPLIRELLKETGDEIIVNRYERLTPLEVEQDSLDGDLSRVQKGDCIVAFSRSAIFALKRQVEMQTGMRCAVVYGKLPPEIRSEQAALFNDPDSGYDVLIGSDAIGMGLNLKIRRVIFESVWKFDGKRDTLLSVSQMKQIAGRAGRFGMHGADEKPGGFVTTLKVEDLPILRKTLALQVPPLLYARIAPPGPMFAGLASRLPANATTESIFLASMHAGLCPPYCRPNIPDQLSTVCDYMDQLGHFTLPDKVFIMQAPFPWRDRTALETINTFIGTYYQSMNVDLVPILERLGYMEMLENAEAAMKSPEGRGTTGRRFKPSNELPGLETFHKILVAYMWLSFRNPVSYSAQDQTMELKERLEHTLHWCLQEMTRIDGKNSVHVQSKRAPIVFKTPREMQLEAQQLGASEAQKRTVSAELLSAPI
ncbi:P-loop containing nucleoside triphosphate hydrolase protein [Mycena albidolilacea]|uniref:P-loop containing nucleoside triphosphate hydrolase protein n=1 Tax=Mycena albidolilacea TaxID=1033008 RepID=A0AAD7ESP2_9AGAR|nr:P-loop containing nucleoside triphosphate hydrolase protein [Mycena albidolilacea]